MLSGWSLASAFAIIGSVHCCSVSPLKPLRLPDQETCGCFTIRPPACNTATATMPDAGAKHAAVQIPAAGSGTTVDANSLDVTKPPTQRLDPVFAAKPSFSLGPLDIHAGSVVRQFRFRQKVNLSNCLQASAGIYYDLKSDKIGPTGALIYKLDKDTSSKSRIEINDRQALARKGWDLKFKQVTVGVSAECSLTFKGEDGKISKQALKPDLHVSLDHVKPLKYQLMGIGVLLLLNLPIKLSDKEVEAPLPWGLGRLKGFATASLKRTGYTHYKVAVQEASGVLDL